MDNLHIFLDLLFTFRNISSWQSRGLPLSLLCLNKIESVLEENSFVQRDGMVWSAEGLASFSDKIRKHCFEKHMVSSGQSNTPINFLWYNLEKCIFYWKLFEHCW